MYDRIEGWFSNMGQKIKRLAIWSFIVESIIIIIAAIILPIFVLSEAGFGAWFLAFLIVTVAACFAILLAYVGQWLLYGFGVLVERAENPVFFTKHLYSNKQSNTQANNTAEQATEKEVEKSIETNEIKKETKAEPINQKPKSHSASNESTPHTYSKASPYFDNKDRIPKIISKDISKSEEGDCEICGFHGNVSEVTVKRYGNKFTAKACDNCIEKYSTEEETNS